MAAESPPRRRIFGRGVLTLVSGTVLGHGLLIASIPLLSRLFNPAAFGLLTLYATFTGLGAYVASGRYDLAIVLPESDEDGANLVSVAVTLSAISAAILTLAVILFRRDIAGLVGTPGIEPWLLTLPVSVFAAATTQALNVWFQRIERYRAISTNRVLVSVLTVGCSAAFAKMGMRNGGLVLGALVGQIVGSALYLWTARISIGERSLSLQRSRATQLMKAYRHFPAFAVLSSLIGYAGASAPVLLMGPALGADAVGYFGMTQRMLGLPTVVIGQAFADVFRQRAAREVSQTGHCRAAWMQTFRELVVLSVPSFVLVAVVAPIVAPIILGSKWVGIGDYVRILTVLYFVGFVVSPLARTLQLEGENLHYDLWWQIGLFMLTSLGVYIGCRTLNLRITLWLYVATYTFMYLLYFVLSYRFAVRVRPPKET